MTSSGRSGMLLLPRDPPAPRGQSLDKLPGAPRQHRDGGESDGLAGRVLEEQVLDVDVGVADLREEPRELSGGVGHQDRDDLERPRCTAVLARDATNTVVAGLHDASE